jgi:hypothetical protein
VRHVRALGGPVHTAHVHAHVPHMNMKRAPASNIARQQQCHTTRTERAHFA